MSRRISWLLVLLGALALVGVVILIIDVSGKSAIPDRPDAISDEPNVEPNAAASRAGSERVITPRRTAESEPARTVEIEVARASGAPIADVPVVVFREDDVLLSAKTDRAGLVRLAASTGEAHAVAAVPGYKLLEARVSMEDERTRLVLPDGLEISGVVRVDGRVPKHTVTVFLWRDDSQPLEIPDRVREILGFTTYRWEWRAATDAEGRFRFMDLPADTVAHLDLDFPYEAIVRVGDKTLDSLRAPAKDVLVEARHNLEISGRVVDADTRAAIPRAPVVIEYLQLNGTRGLTGIGSGWPSGADGRFKIMLRASSVASLTVKASASPGAEPTEIKIDENLNDDRDVGDIAARVGRLVTLLVKGEGAKPVANARAAPPEMSRKECSEPTDADGKTSLRLTHEATSLKVGALGYEVVEVPVPADLTGLLEVTLPASTMLTVRVETGGAPVPGLLVKIRTTRHYSNANMIPFGGKDEPLMAAGMSGPVASSFGAKGGTYSFDSGAEGVVRLSGLPPNKATRVEVTDCSGAPQFSEEITLAKGERREVVAAIAGRPRTFKGVVTDEAGKPIRGAVVMVAHDAANLTDREYRSGWTHTAKTDREGRFTLKHLCVSSTHVGVAKSGYAALIQRDVPIPADGGEARLVLVETPPVRVRISDSSGGPVDVQEVTGSMWGASIARPGREGAGVYVFADCGNGSLDVRAKHANGTWSTTIDTSRTREGRITVPMLGGARLTWTKDLDEDRQVIVSLNPQDPTLEFVGRRVNPGDKEFRFKDVAPGVYTASIEVDPRTFENPARRKPLAEARVEVVEGQTAEVVFKRP